MRRGARGGKARWGGGASDGPQRLPPAVRVQRVDRPHEPRRHVAPDDGLPEGAGTGDERWHEGERVSHRRALPVRAGQHRDPATAVGEDLDGVRPQADDELSRVPSRAGQIAASVHGDDAALVRTRAYPAHGIEGDAWQDVH